MWTQAQIRTGMTIVAIAAPIAAATTPARADRYSLAYSSCGSRSHYVTYQRDYYRPTTVATYVERPAYVYRRPIRYVAPAYRTHLSYYRPVHRAYYRTGHHSYPYRNHRIYHPSRHYYRGHGRSAGFGYRRHGHAGGFSVRLRR